MGLSLPPAAWRVLTPLIDLRASASGKDGWLFHPVVGFGLLPSEPDSNSTARWVLRWYGISDVQIYLGQTCRERGSGWAKGQHLKQRSRKGVMRVRWDDETEPFISPSAKQDIPLKGQLVPLTLTSQSKSEGDRTQEAWLRKTQITQ